LYINHSDMSHGVSGYTFLTAEIALHSDGGRRLH
jgi:hypothetical protein